MTPDERAAFLLLLRRLEWSAKGARWGRGDWAQKCPVCTGGPREGHDAGCELAACIRVLEGKA